MAEPIVVMFDIDGVIRDVGGSYRRALADTVEHFTGGPPDGGTVGSYRPTPEDIDVLKSEGTWNNDWEASQELIKRYFAAHSLQSIPLDLTYETIVAFFQTRYRGETPTGEWTGYICQEALLVTPAYFAGLTAAGLPWGFFSGATRASATYVLQRRLGLEDPLLIAMEDGPGKPDPTGLFTAVAALKTGGQSPVIYVGDTVADMLTVVRARELDPTRQWIGVGVLPPHVQTDPNHSARYAEGLRKAGAAVQCAGAHPSTSPAVGNPLNAVGLVVHHPDFDGLRLLARRQYLGSRQDQRWESGGLDGL
jgi:HAD superfamily phosphatase